MCLASTPSVVYPEVAGTRDTSNELIVSDYELSEENKKKNAEIMAAKNKAKSLVNFSDDNDGPQGSPHYQVGTSGDFSTDADRGGFGSGRGTSNDAYGGSSLA